MVVTRRQTVCDEKAKYKKVNESQNKEFTRAVKTIDRPTDVRKSKTPLKRSREVDALLKNQLSMNFCHDNDDEYDRVIYDPDQTCARKGLRKRKFSSPFWIKGVKNIGITYADKADSIQHQKRIRESLCKNDLILVPDLVHRERQSRRKSAFPQRPTNNETVAYSQMLRKVREKVLRKVKPHDETAGNPLGLNATGHEYIKLDETTTQVWSNGATFLCYSKYSGLLHFSPNSHLARKAVHSITLFLIKGRTSIQNNNQNVEIEPFSIIHIRKGNCYAIQNNHEADDAIFNFFLDLP